MQMVTEFLRTLGPVRRLQCPPRMRASLVLLSLVSLLSLVAACSSDNVCDPVAQSGCDSGRVCEESAAGGDPICAKPLVLRGQVFRLDDQAAVAGADLVALDVNGAAASAVATSASDGTYSLAVPAKRDAQGRPANPPTVTLRADAAGYHSFPSGIRQSLPIDTATATEDSDAFVVMSALTDVGLFVDASAGQGSIAGTVDLPAGSTGALVVAEAAAKGYTAIADRTGAYRIFNVPPGAYTVSGYAQGVSFADVTANVTAGATATADLARDTRALAGVTGSVTMVDPGSGDATSVILVVESTFDAALARGETPPGLRAPAPGTAPNVTGQFSIAGVPAGKYVVLAGFENDNLVRDPDTAISGTQIVHIVVAGQDVPIGTAFKMTGALDVIGPGKDGPEMVAAKPTLSWKDDSGEESYLLKVYDALGNEVWSKTLPKFTGTDPAIPYEGPLDAGMYYQFKAWSVKLGGSFLSTTEDLRGVFYKP